MLAAAVLMANVNAMTSASAYDVIDQANMVVWLLLSSGGYIHIRS